MPYGKLKCPPIRPVEKVQRPPVLTPIVKDVKRKTVGSLQRRGGPIQSSYRAGYQQSAAVDDDATPNSVPEEGTEPVAMGGTGTHTFKVSCSAAPIDHQPSAEQKQQRYKAEAENWQQFQTDVADRHLVTLTRRTQLAQDYQDAVQRQLTAAISTGACDKCGLSTSNCQLLRHVTVVVVDNASCHTVQVPIFACPRCEQAQHFAAETSEACQASQQPTPQNPGREEGQQGGADHLQHTSVPAEQAGEAGMEDAGPQPPSLQQQQQQRPRHQHPVMFSLHPFEADCFPSTPVYGVYLHLTAQHVVPIWFTMRFLEQAYIQRQHIQRMAVSKAAESQRQFLQGQLYSAFPCISSDRFRKAFATTLDQYALMRLKLSRRHVLQLPPESLVGCCTVCRMGHLEFLQQQGVLEGNPGGLAAQSSAAAGNAAPEPLSCGAAAFPGAADGTGPSRPPVKAHFAALGTALVLHSVMIDGLQKMRHLANAGRASGRVPAVSERLQLDLDFKLWEDVQHGAADGAPSLDPCNTFKADKALGRRSEMFDQSGIVTMLCRHGFLLAAVNMPTGERWAYAIFLLNLLMREHNILPYVMMYDINCKFKAHFKRWVQQQSSWPEWMQQFTREVMALPLGPLHVHMHTAACQAVNSLNQVVAGGTAIGEPTEQMNRFLGLAGVVLQYTTLAARALWLEVLFRQWNQRKWLDLPRLLVSSGFRAQTRIIQLTEQQGELAGQAVDIAKAANTYDECFWGQVLSWGKCPSSPLGGQQTAAERMAWEVEVALLLAQLGGLNRHDNQLLPSGLVQQDMGLDAAAITSRDKRLRALLAEHPEANTWSPDNPALKRAVALLCEHKVMVQQQLLEHLVRDYAFSKWLQARIGDVSRKEHQKVGRELLRLSGKITAAVKLLLEWAGQRQRYKPYLGLAASGASLADTWHCTPMQQLLEKLYAGELPWPSRVVAEDHSLDPKLAKIKHQMGLVALDLRAAQQEQQLVAYEIRIYTASMCQELEELDAAVATQALQYNTAVDQQDSLEAALEDAAMQLRDRYGLVLELRAAEKAASRAHTRMLLLQQKLDATSALQSKANTMFARYSRACSSSNNSSQAAAAALGAAAAMFDDVVVGQGADDVGTDDADGFDVLDDDLSDGEPDGMHDDNNNGLGGTTTEEAATAGMSLSGDAEPAAAAATVGAAVRSTLHPPLKLQPIKSWKPFRGPDGVLCGPEPQQPWGLQLPPWQAEPTAVQDYQQLSANNAYPGSLAASIASAGKVSLLSGADVVTGTLERLMPGEWWNDELVNYGMWMLQQRDAALHGRWDMVPGALHGRWDGMQAVSCHFFSSFFMHQLYLNSPHREVTYAAVRKWTSQPGLTAAGQANHAEGVLKCSLLVAPCNLDQRHWVLVVADLDRRRILYLDPYGGRRPDIADAMAMYVREEARHKRHELWDTASWPRLYPTNIPRQEDGCSCGLYALVLADCLGAGVPLEHCRMGPADMAAVRARMLADICAGVVCPGV